ncbi:MAG: hypothetical protein KA533_07195 [Sphingobium sp.]|nr:hypothetical protein [Sphingobium sp.]MBP6111751.1 hypothetical protein [Sphingobium sp.]MBP8671298.1 hypothetical protein [Sphingobium sp.]MBP9158351.1 hypothetical protein [Sphingobium sp.]MCC6482070.1 hypothetical protein [Sphingomonadaceae bacterium]
MAAAFIAGRQFFSALLHFFAAWVCRGEFMAENRDFQDLDYCIFLPLFCRSSGNSEPLTT